jgi:hypothetical protein
MNVIIQATISDHRMKPNQSVQRMSAEAFSDSRMLGSALIADLSR